MFGGTWTQIKDRFILAAGDSYTNGATGGAATVTLSINNMPNHTHTFTPSGNVSSHSHGMASHTHTFTPSGSVSSHSHGLNSHTHSFSHTHDYSGSGTTDGMSDNSTGSVWNNDSADGIFNGSQMRSNGNIKLSGSVHWAGGNVEYTDQQNRLDIDVSHTHNFSWSGTTTSQSTSTTGSASGDTASATPSFTGDQGTTGAASGNTDSSTPTFTGDQGTTSSDGSGTAFNILPPYIVKYCWERTA